jgi:ABC-type Na+ transport system ATPase subunit NatA
LEKVADEVLLIHEGQLIQRLTRDDTHDQGLESLLLEISAR